MMYKQTELLTIFNLTPIQALRPKLRYINLKIDDATTLKFNWLHQRGDPEYKGCKHFLQGLMDELNVKLSKLERTKQYINTQIAHYKDVQRAKETNQPIPQPIFTEYDKEYIKTHTPIELVMGTPKKVEINRKWFICPFHKDTNPSFLWNVDKHYGHCFVCETSGDILALHQKINDTTFAQTLKLLS